MQTLLIADQSEIFADALESVLSGQYCVLKAPDGNTALEYLCRYRPDVAIINLMLPYRDGLTVLQQSAFHPHIIIALTSCMSTYIQQAVTALGIDYTMIAPSVDAVVIRLRHLCQSYTAPAPDLRTLIQHHLQLLSIPTHLVGYRQLCAAISLYKSNPDQLMTKELYPAVAKLCGCRDGRLVEHSIRKAITAAWNVRDIAIWRKYFPLSLCNGSSCPSNKVFLCAVAAMLETD